MERLSDGGLSPGPPPPSLPCGAKTGCLTCTSEHLNEESSLTEIMIITCSLAETVGRVRGVHDVVRWVFLPSKLWS